MKFSPDTHFSLNLNLMSRFIVKFSMKYAFSLLVILTTIFPGFHSTFLSLIDLQIKFCRMAQNLTPIIQASQTTFIVHDEKSLPILPFTTSTINEFQMLLTGNYFAGTYVSNFFEMYKL